MDKCRHVHGYDCCFEECHDEEEKLFIDGKLDKTKVFEWAEKTMENHPLLNEARDKWITMNQKVLEICEKISNLVFSYNGEKRGKGIDHVFFFSSSTFG